MKKNLTVSALVIIASVVLSGMRYQNKERLILKDDVNASKGKLLFKDDFDNKMVYSKEYQKVTEGWEVRANHAKWEQTKNGVNLLLPRCEITILLLLNLLNLQLSVSSSVFSNSSVHYDQNCV